MTQFKYRTLFSSLVLVSSVACGSCSSQEGSPAPDGSTNSGGAGANAAATDQPSANAGEGNAGESTVPNAPSSNGGNTGVAPDETEPPANTDPPASDPALAGLSVEELVGKYEQGELEYPALATAVQAAAQEAPDIDADLSQLGMAVSNFVFLKQGEYTLPSSLEVTGDGHLVLGPGAKITAAAGVELKVAGSLYLIGQKGAEAGISGTSADQPFAGIQLLGKRSELHYAQLHYGNILMQVLDTGDTPILVEQSTFDSWVGIEEPLAIFFSNADGLTIRSNNIGLNTPENETIGESIKGKDSAARIETNQFGRRLGYEDILDLGPCGEGHYPIVIGNVFLGGEDDAIDLDSCTGFIIGNYLKDFVGQVDGKGDGGCLTGDGAGSMLIVNNILENCIHAIGFKENTRPIMLNNTIVASDEGFRVLGNVKVRAVGNIFWDNTEDLSGNTQQAASYLTASNNLFSIPGFENDNQTGDPLFEDTGGLPYGLSAASPALGKNYGELAQLIEGTPFTIDQLRKYLGKDYLGNPRQLPDIDLGAIERP